MKNKIVMLTIITFIFLTNINGTHAQEKNVAEIKHYKRPAFEKFVGTWVYQDKGEYFKIVLYKTESKGDGYIVDFISGYHLYKKDGVVVDGFEENKEKTISVGSFSPRIKNENILSFRFRETEKRILATGTLNFKTDKPNQLIFNLNLAEGGAVKIDGKGDTYELHVPNNLVLKRLK